MLVGYSLIATFVFGVDTVLFVWCPTTSSGPGAEGYGYLLAGLGVGGVLAAGLVTRLERLPRLGVVILAAMAAYCLPTLVFLVVDQPVVAFVSRSSAERRRWSSTCWRSPPCNVTAPASVLARVFGAFNALVLLAPSSWARS